MYVHAGNNRIIRTRDIIGIFDMDTATMQGATREYLRRAEKSGRMVNIKEEIPKSFILYREGDGFNICFSQLSSVSLYGRLSYYVSGKQ